MNRIAAVPATTRPVVTRRYVALGTLSCEMGVGRPRCRAVFRRGPYRKDWKERGREQWLLITFIFR